MIDDVTDALAVYRLTRLVIEDRVPFGKARSAVLRSAYARLESTEIEQPYIVELLSCPWCMSMWVGFGVLAVRRFAWWRPLSRVLAASAVAGFLAGQEEH